MEIELGVEGRFNFFIDVITRNKKEFTIKNNTLCIDFKKGEELLLSDCMEVNSCVYLLKGRLELEITPDYEGKIFVLTIK